MYLFFVGVILCVVRPTISGVINVDYETNYPPSCSRKIFCESNLLHDVALSGINEEMNVTYTRKKLLFPEDVILERYEILRERNGGKALPNPELLHFIQENFEDPQELIEWVPDDFKQETTLMGRVKDKDYLDFLRKLQEIWKELFRKVSPDVAVNEDRYSIIYIPNGFCIAGGHFQEMYYWDTFWIIEGLLLSDMAATVRGIIENFLTLVRRFRFVPNGTRVYYLNRSQPPLLIQMVNSYLQYTNDFFFVRENLQTLTNEFEWWQENREVKFVKDDKTYVMFRYNARSRGPRPESYIHDWEIGHRIESKIEQDRWYSDIKSAAESGWDFSTRWFKSENNNRTLRDIHTSACVQVELNSIMQKNADLLSEWWYRSGDQHKGKYYREFADQLLLSIHEVFWREDLGSWFDWDLMNHKHNDNFYPSNMAPLWTESYTLPRSYVAGKVIKYLKREKIICDDGTPHYFGVPTSLVPSGQQWDFPNAWSPLQMFMIEGLDRTGCPEAQKIALQLAQNWVATNYKGFLNSEVMFEKYDAVKEGVYGGGGEYKVQTGFGWTNGAIIILLNRYCDILSPSQSHTC